MNEHDLFNWWPIVIQVGGLIVTAVGLLIRVTWQVADTYTDLKQKFDVHVEELRAEFIKSMHEKNSQDQADLERLTRRYGESLLALRTKVTEMELWNRDNFVDKPTFTAAINDFKSSWARLEDRLDIRFDKLEKKLDQAIMNKPHDE